ncbi:restriction endonuclease PLD domain-containing protein, partial [Escherichia coli]|uniref:restriction endonuclease PLD domain-containing protein n=1 Tax=Escherichia coli TaxID=562 RepID=UPI001954B431
ARQSSIALAMGSAAHTTSDGNKQFSAAGDELILGRWIKGRLAAAGLVTPVNDTQADTDRLE